jgi:hypothetical protein
VPFVTLAELRGSFHQHPSNIINSNIQKEFPMKSIKFVITGFALVAMSTAAVAANSNVCASVADYMNEQCNTPKGPTDNCEGAMEQYQACLAGERE